MNDDRVFGHFSSHLRRRGSDVEQMAHRSESSASTRLQVVHSSDDFAKRTRAQHAEALSDFGSYPTEIRHDHLGRADEPRAHEFVLRGDAGRTSIQMTLPRHDAAEGQERGGPEPEFVCAKQGGDHDIAAELEPTIHAEADALPKIGRDERAMSLPKPDLPRQPSILDRSER